MAPQVDVKRDELLSQAKVWDGLSSDMQRIKNEIDATEQSIHANVHEDDQTLGNLFIFAVAVTTYNKVAQDISTVVGEGRQMMQRIGDALVKANQTYSATEQASILSSGNAVS